MAGDDGRARAEHEREPRLPPPPARAQTAAVSARNSAPSANPMMSKKAREFMGVPPGAILPHFAPAHAVSIAASFHACDPAGRVKVQDSSKSRGVSFEPSTTLSEASSSV